MINVSLDKCLKKIPNRFELVMLSAARAARIMAGAPTEYNESRTKPCLVALKEIEEGKITKEDLEKVVLERYKDEHSNLNLRRFAEENRVKELEVDSLFTLPSTVAEETDPLGLNAIEPAAETKPSSETKD